MLPALPPLALVAAPVIHLFLRKIRLQQAALAAAVLLTITPAITGLLRITEILPRSPLNAWPLAAAYDLLAMAAVNTVVLIALRKRESTLRFCAVYAIAIAFFHKGLVPTINAKEAGVEAIAAMSASATAPLFYVQWDERTWLYSRAEFAHDGIAVTNAQCAAAHWTRQHGDSHWLLRAPDAIALGLRPGPIFDSGDKTPWIISPGVPAIGGCENSNGPRYVFKWNAESLRRIHGS
jgi:hypothetical protein